MMFSAFAQHLDAHLSGAAFDEAELVAAPRDMSRLRPVQAAGPRSLMRTTTVRPA